jgi:hypothetical protein
MVRKKNMTAERIIEMYMSEILLGTTGLSSVYVFAKNNNFEEAQFYKYFNSFASLEKKIFAKFCEKTVEILLENEDYKTYDAKSKLLSFYFTFFETLTANRSYVLLALRGDKNKLESLKLLSNLRLEFIEFISSEIHIDSIDFKNDKINKIQDKSFAEVSWIQLLFTLQFWLEDESVDFEKTDIFIEKSVKASFDLKDLTPLTSVFDFAKFLWKEKVPVL